MKNIARMLSIGMLLSLCVTKSVASEDVKTVLVPLLSHTNDLSHTYHQPMMSSSNDCFMIDGNISYTYKRSFDEKYIAQHLFGNENLSFVGADGGQEATAFGAENFGFGSDSNFSFEMDPLFQHHTIGLNVQLGYNKMWMKATLPIVHAKWELNRSGWPTSSVGTNNLQEGGEVKFETTTAGVLQIQNTDGTAFEDATLEKLNKKLDNASIGQFDLKQTSVEMADFSFPSSHSIGSTIIEVDTDQSDIELTIDDIPAASTVRDGLSGFTFGNLSSREYNQFDLGDSDTRSKWEVGDIHLTAGYDFCKKNDRHFGVHIDFTIPTGTEIDKSFMKKVATPVIGNGDHYELGGGLSGHYEMWAKDEKSFIGCFDARLTHKFSSSRFVSCDHMNIPMSRYALIKKLSSDLTYDGTLMALGDVNAGMADVKSNLKGEFVIDFIYRHCNWEIGAGYNFIGQTKEQFKDNISLGNNIYGYKGTSSEAMLNSTKNTIATKTTAITYGDSTAANNTFGPLKVESSNDVMPRAYWGANAFGVEAEEEASASNTFTLPHLNNTGLMNGQILHKIFGHVDYVFMDSNWMPHVGINGSVALSTDSYRTPKYWELGVKAGFSY